MFLHYWLIYDQNKTWCQQYILACMTRWLIWTVYCCIYDWISRQCIVSFGDYFKMADTEMNSNNRKYFLKFSNQQKKLHFCPFGGKGLGNRKTRILLRVAWVLTKLNYDIPIKVAYCSLTKITLLEENCVWYKSCCMKFSKQILYWSTNDVL